MNLFRIVADMLHLLSFILLIKRMRDKQNCMGLSYRFQELLLIVFCTRYIDIFQYFSYSYYNSVMKILFISSTIYIIYLMRFHKFISIVCHSSI